MHVGNLKTIAFGQRVLIEVRSDGRFVHRRMGACWSNRCCENLADGQGAEHG